MKLIFEKSIPGRKGVALPESDVPVKGKMDKKFMRKSSTRLCELSEPDIVRHFTMLSTRNFGVDTNFYPLGSCTMKYNPKILEKIAELEGFSGLHPLLPQLRHGGMLTQGALSVAHELENMLCEICEMDAFTLHPMAGAHGELTGMMLIAAYHKDRGSTHKTEMIIPDEAHGTNPASASIAGFSTVPVPTDKNTGSLDLKRLKEAINDKTAGIMLTNPNTLGIFNSDIEQVAEMLHKKDALLYYDGANLNAVMDKFKPGSLFDVIHLNLHKTFGTPHGGGGPGAGPVGVKKNLIDYLPVSRVIKRTDGTYALNYDYPESIGYIAPFYGNFSVCLKAYAYIYLLGKNGLKEVSENAVLNANYLMNHLKKYYDLPFDMTCMHEFVLSASRQMKNGVHAIDIAKALIDEGFHPPTCYFPLIVKEAMMIEPTETENKETLDRFIDVMIKIAREAVSNPEKLKKAPFTTRTGRLDEKKAVKDMNFCYLENNQ